MKTIKQYQQMNRFLVLLVVILTLSTVYFSIRFEETVKQLPIELKGEK